MVVPPGSAGQCGRPSESLQHQPPELPRGGGRDGSGSPWLPDRVQVELICGI